MPEFMDERFEAAWAAVVAPGRASKGFCLMWFEMGWSARGDAAQQLAEADAPALLEALRGLLDAETWYAADPCLSTRVGLDSATSRARAAIKQAEGG